MSAFISGLSRDNAIRLLNAAMELGLSEDLVLTQEDGFIVPDEIADHAFPPVKPSKSKPAATDGVSNG